MCSIQCVSCNVRSEFNHLVGNVVTFNVHVNEYTFDVGKGRMKTRLYGNDRQRLITQKRLSGGDMLVFSLARGNNKILLAMMNMVADESEDDDGSHEGAESEDDEEASSEEVMPMKLGHTSEIQTISSV